MRHTLDDEDDDTVLPWIAEVQDDWWTEQLIDLRTGMHEVRGAVADATAAQEMDDDDDQSSVHDAGGSEVGSGAASGEDDTGAGAGGVGSYPILRKKFNASSSYAGA